MKRILVSLAALTLLTAAALPASAGVLYSQQLDPAFSGREQSGTANGALVFNNQAFDNFSLAAGGTVNNVSWTGLLGPSFTTIDSFTISFYEDDFDNVDSPGSIGTPVGVSTTIFPNSVTGLIAGQNPNSTQPNPDNGFEAFNFDAAITPFVAKAGATYWISIFANPEANGDFYWAFSNQGDGMFEVSNNNGVGIINTDLAFTLSNSTVPEPSGLMLDGTGLLMLAGFGRRLLARSFRK